MEIKKENLLNVINIVDEKWQDVIYTLFPELKKEQTDKCPVTERIKTFEDAVNELGNDHPYVEAYNSFEHNVTASVGGEYLHDVRAYLMLRIICAALNEGWQPEFTKNEWRYYPWPYLYTQEEIDDMDEEEKSGRHLISTGDHQTEYAGLACSSSGSAPSSSTANLGSRLCLKSNALAAYCGGQFIDLWADFCLIRKEGV